jgi:hypothetical protein
MGMWRHPAAHITYTLSRKTEIATPAVSFPIAMTKLAAGNGRTVSTFLTTRTSRNISTDLDYRKVPETSDESRCQYITGGSDRSNWWWKQYSSVQSCSATSEATCAASSNRL